MRAGIGGLAGVATALVALGCGAGAPPAPTPAPTSAPTSAPRPAELPAEPAPAPPPEPVAPAARVPLALLPPALDDVPRHYVEVREVDGAWVRWEGWCDAHAAEIRLTVRDGMARVGVTYGQDGDDFPLVDVETTPDGLRLEGEKTAIELVWLDRAATRATARIWGSEGPTLMGAEAASRLRADRQKDCEPMQ